MPLSLSAGAKVNSYFNMGVYKINYLYSSEFFVLKIGDDTGSFIQNNLGGFLLNLSYYILSAIGEVHRHTMQ